MLQSTVNDILTLIESYRQINKIHIDSAEKNTDLLTSIQTENHQKIQKVAQSGQAVNKDKYQFSNHLFETTDTLLNKLEEMNKEELMWINLSITYTELARQKNYKIDLTSEHSNLEIDRKIQLLGLMIVDLEKEEKYEYCSYLKKKYECLHQEMEFV